EEAILKRAVALRVTFTAPQGAVKVVTISNPDDLGPILAELRVRQEERYREVMFGPRFIVGGRNSVDFVFPNGMARNVSLEAPHLLGDCEVDPRFYHKLCEVLSRMEKRPIDLLRDNPDVKWDQP